MVTKTGSPRNAGTKLGDKRYTSSTIDYFPTPPSATRQFMDWCVVQDMLGDRESCLEPVAGGGHMADVLEDYFGIVSRYDLYDPENKGYEKLDFANALCHYPPHDWVITNPPFILAADFIERGLEIATRGVAMICRLALLEGKSRYERIYSRRPPSHVLVHSTRIDMTPGKLESGRGGQICFAWFVWLQSDKCGTTRLDWLR